MKLLYAPASPYSAKVRMAARHLGIALEEQVVDTNAAPPELTGPNPLGKIPVLIRKDGGAVFDSRAIMLFLHRESGKKLYPKGEAGTQAQVLEALCDGITDSLLSVVYERRFRPAEMVYQPWIDRQWDKVSRGLAYLEADLPDPEKSLHGGIFALAAMTGYLALRFEGLWEADHPKLAALPKRFAKAFNAYGKLAPRAA